MKKLRNVLVGLAVLMALTVPQNVLMANPPGPPNPPPVCSLIFFAFTGIPGFVIVLLGCSIVSEE